MRLAVMIAGAAALFAGGAALAGTPYPRTIKCPVGGKTFTYTATMSYSTWGSRPDGKPYGSWIFPLPLAKCPDNGLVVFDEFKPAEIQRLAAVIATDEYRALAARETNYFLAGWLMEKLGRDPATAAWMVVEASWEAEGDPEQKARYQRLYVDKIRALPKGEDPATWLMMQGRAANGLRELGRFDEAKALLATLDLKPFDVPVPEETVVGTTPSGAGRQISNFEEIRVAKRKRSFLGYFEQLAKAIDRRDARSEPIGMIPQSVAKTLCEAKDARLSEADKADCAALPHTQ